MTVVGFDFTKIIAEKKDSMKGKVNINNNVTIKDIKEHSLNLGTDKKNAVKFSFEFTTKYEPDFGEIVLEGYVIFMEDSNKIKDVLDNWKKDKKLDKELSGVILNTVLAKSNVQALILSQNINLPPPIPLPKVEVGTKAASSEAKKK